MERSSFLSTALEGQLVGLRWRGPHWDVFFGPLHLGSLMTRRRRLQFEPSDANLSPMSQEQPWMIGHPRPCACMRARRERSCASGHAGPGGTAVARPSVTTPRGPRPSAAADTDVENVGGSGGENIRVQSRLLVLVGPGWVRPSARLLCFGAPRLRETGRAARPSSCGSGFHLDSAEMFWCGDSSSRL